MRREGARIAPGRRGRFVAGIALCLAVAAVALAPRTPDQRLAEARRLVDGVRAVATVDGATFMATTAIADFGVGAEVRLVRVRIVDELRITVSITTDTAVELAVPPRLCLVGPDAAPDDAGLSDRCWGDPDLTAVLAEVLGAGSDAPGGRLRLPQGEPIVSAVGLRRGAVRCDYPSGTWQLEVWLTPMVDGVPAGPLQAPTPTLVVPIADSSAPLVLARDGRYCGLAEKVFLEQGEPEVVPS